MDPAYVRRRLRVRADDVHRSLLLEYGETTERERTVELSGSFPDTPDDLFPWATVTVLTDPDRERVLLVRSDRADADWEPPGGRGDPEESVATTARRGALEAVGVDPEVTDLLLVERLAFEYDADGVTAPVVQAVFHAVVPADAVVDGPAEARWFDRDSLPDRVRFGAAVERALGGADDGD